MSVAIKLDESYARPGVFGWGNGIEPVEEIRERYREEGPIRLREKLTAKQRDILGMLRSARRPVALKEMFLALDALPRTWVGYDSGGLTMALDRLAARGLAEKIPAPPSPRKMAPRVLWQIAEVAVQAEGLASVNELAGVGPDTGAHYLNRKATARRPRRVRQTAPPLRLVAQPRTDEEQAELDALVKEQKKQQAKDEYWNAERPKGSQSVYPHAKMQSLDAPTVRWRHESSVPNSLLSGHDKIPTSSRDEPHGALEEADRQERMAAILGELDIEDVDRLDDATLDHLRSCLREEGLVSISVMGKERERLRQPARHRGGAPPPAHTHMSTKLKHRKPGHQSSAGGSRGSRKSRKRWAREKGEW